MPEKLVIVGAGGFGRETADVVAAINAAGERPRWDLLGVIDDGPSPENLSRLEARRIPYLGTTAVMLAREERPRYVVGIGSPQVRAMLAHRFDAQGFSAATLIDPGATIGSECFVGEGSVILTGARVTTNVRLGRHVHLNPNATVGHDSVLGDFVSMNPGSSVSGDCTIEGRVLVGVGAVVLNQLHVGAGALIGAASCVTKHVAPGVTVAGVPAREMTRPTA